MNVAYDAPFRPAIATARGLRAAQFVACSGQHPDRATENRRPRPSPRKGDPAPRRDPPDRAAHPPQGRRHAPWAMPPHPPLQHSGHAIVGPRARASMAPGTAGNGRCTRPAPTPRRATADATQIHTKELFNLPVLHYVFIITRSPMSRKWSFHDWKVFSSARLSLVEASNCHFSLSADFY